ncbi:MAG: TadE/TadG family type IV pilus assembly protein [Desulfovibrionaceae bacterium]
MERGEHKAGRRSHWLVALPVLCLTLLYGVEAGRMVWAERIVTRAAQVGAQLAAVGGRTDAEVAAAVERVMILRGMDGDHSVSIEGAGDQPLRVLVEARVSPLVLPLALPKVAAAGTAARL